MKSASIYWVVIYGINVVLAFEYFQQLIPNGNRVPDPCNRSRTWPAVGHNQRQGDGHRNRFGIDFLKNGRKWREELCRADSDGDGLTNGEELGDPTCKWEPGLDSILQHNISHPGFCQEKFLNSSCLESAKCQANVTECPALLEKGTQNITIQLPRTRVPSQTTTYTCFIFNFPREDNHVVATRPIIDNHEVVHHMLLFGCDEAEGEVTEDLYTPFECGMIASPKCASLIGIWSKGMSGECLHNSTGFRIGQEGFRKGALQIHWNNVNKKSGMTDASGMIIYYTSLLRQYDAGIMVVGQYWINLPPKQIDVAVIAECSSKCSKKLIKDEIEVTAVYNHMHYLGRQERVELYRHDRKVQDLAFDESYSYDLPILHSFQNTIKVFPGDKIKIKCVYSTMSRTENVIFGDSTSDEMCLSFITYFPKENLVDPYCTNWKSVPLCLLWHKDNQDDINDCFIQKFMQGKDFKANRIVQNLIQACSPYKTCSELCKYSIDVAKRHPCFQGDVLDFIGYENRLDLPEYLIPFIICDYRKDLNFSTEVLLRKTQHISTMSTNSFSVRTHSITYISSISILVFMIYL